MEDQKIRRDLTVVGLVITTTAFLAVLAWAMWQLLG